MYPVIHKSNDLAACGRVRMLQIFLGNFYEE